MRGVARPFWQGVGHVYSRRQFGSMRLVFVNRDQRREVTGDFVGKNILEVAHEFEVDLEGACEGSCACSTCHVILDDDVYDALPEPSEEEEDMLDLVR